MLGLVARAPVPGGRYIASPGGLGHLSLFGDHAPHRDGFGYAWLDGEGRLNVRRWGREELARAPAVLPGAPYPWASLLIAHVRKASPIYSGDLSARAAHPFLSGGIALAHNGTVRAADWLGGGGSDSALLADWLAASWRPRTPDDLARALEELVGRTSDFTALNILVSNGEGLGAFRCYRREPGYYTLWYRRGKDEVVVSSEPLFGDGWELLDSGELLWVGPDLELRRFPGIPCGGPPGAEGPGPVISPT